MERRGIEKELYISLLAIVHLLEEENNIFPSDVCPRGIVALGRTFPQCIFRSLCLLSLKVVNKSKHTFCDNTPFFCSTKRGDVRKGKKIGKG